MIIKIELDGGLDKFISGANSAAAAVGSMEERIVRQGMMGKNASSAVGFGTTRLTPAFSVWVATTRVLIPMAALASAPLTFFCKSVVAATADTAN